MCHIHSLRSKQESLSEKALLEPGPSRLFLGLNNPQHTGLGLQQLSATGTGTGAGVALAPAGITPAMLPAMLPAFCTYASNSAGTMRAICCGMRAPSAFIISALPLRLPRPPPPPDEDASRTRLPPSGAAPPPEDVLLEVLYTGSDAAWRLLEPPFPRLAVL